MFPSTFKLKVLFYVSVELYISAVSPSKHPNPFKINDVLTVFNPFKKNVGRLIKIDPINRFLYACL